MGHSITICIVETDLVRFLRREVVLAMTMVYQYANQSFWRLLHNVKEQRDGEHM